MENTEFISLLKKYRQGHCSPEEVQLLESWYLDEGRKKGPVIEEQELVQVKQQLWEAISARQGKQGVRKMGSRAYTYFKLGAVAALLLVFAAGLYMYRTNGNRSGYLKNADLVVPGGNRAVLTLSNGKKVILDQRGNGELAKNQGIEVLKLSDGQLLYKVSASGQKKSEDASLLYNTIETPMGGQYQVILADGTKVWLNAGSSLKYPLAFAGTLRKVELKGEGYFEVAKDKKRPFQVKTEHQLVEVLGTHFNVNAYPDEEEARTTLVEGSVKVSSGQDPEHYSALLKPGQECKLGKGKLLVQQADVEEALAWKNGYFVFDDVDLKTALRKIGRWYNVEVGYDGNFDRIVLDGSVSKFKDINQVLDVLHLTTQLNFTLNGRRIMVSN
eukprot:gene2839-3261_t